MSHSVDCVRSKIESSDARSGKGCKVWMWGRMPSRVSCGAGVGSAWGPCGRATPWRCASSSTVLRRMAPSRWRCSSTLGRGAHSLPRSLTACEMKPRRAPPSYLLAHRCARDRGWDLAAAVDATHRRKPDGIAPLHPATALSRNTTQHPAFTRTRRDLAGVIGARDAGCASSGGRVWFAGWGSQGASRRRAVVSK
jgi:hypothetical protein